VTPLGRGSTGESPVGAHRLFVSRSCKVGLDQTDVDAIARLASPESKLCPSVIIQTALRNKVAGHVYSNLGRVAAAFPHLGLVHEIRRTLESEFSESVTSTSTQTLLAELPTFARTLRAAGVAWLPVKGGALALLRVYPETAPRYMRDLDLMVPDTPSAWKALGVLRQLGYGLHPPILLQRTRQKRLQAIAQLRKSQDGIPLKVEIMVQPFKTTRLSNLEVDLWSGVREVEFRGETISVPSVENLILVSAGHAYHEGPMLKDANDLWLLLRRYGTEIDWSALARAAAANGLVGGLLAVVGLTLGLYGPDPRLVRLVGILRPTAGERAVSRLLARGKGEFPAPLVWAYHEWRHTGANPLGTLLEGWGQSALLRVWLSPRCPGALDRLIRFRERGRIRRWARLAGDRMPVYLAPLPERGSGKGGQAGGAGQTDGDAGGGSPQPALAIFPGEDITYAWDGKAQCLLTPVGPFLPTRYAVVGDSQIEAGSDLASRACSRPGSWRCRPGGGAFGGAGE
jgi:hypothetical protein